MLLKDKCILVTGCNRGIGRAIVERFAANGANVWAHARKQTEDFERDMRTIASNNSVKVEPIYFDLVDNEAMKSAVKQIVASKKNVDVLVNSAGITYNALFQMTASDKFKELMTVNFVAPMLLTQYVVKIMIKHKSGSIVNISSTAAIDGNAGRSLYGASKAAMIASTRSISTELAKHGIRANCIAPGITATDMVAESMSKEVIEETINNTKLKRIGKPVDIADAAVFLASDLSSYVTGQLIRVDGGLL